jgi:hypothetical protein
VEHVHVRHDEIYRTKAERKYCVAADKRTNYVNKSEETTACLESRVLRREGSCLVPSTPSGPSTKVDLRDEATQWLGRGCDLAIWLQRNGH